MGLGRITRFASTPRGAVRVSVMRTMPGGVKALAPPGDLFEDFTREKQALKKPGRAVGDPHLEAFRRTRYRERFRAHVHGDAAARAALRSLVTEAQHRDVYVMCMCPYRTPGEACHTYLLLELARELDGALEILPEPEPRRR
jgi:hypothetical protein